MMDGMSETKPTRPNGAVSLPEAELSWRFSRSSGPGGQHVNTTDTQVELRWDLEDSKALTPALKERARSRLAGAGRLVDGSVVVVRASEHRSQWRNRQTARIRLEALLAEAVAPPPPRRRPTRKSRRVNERRLNEKSRRGELKQGRSGRIGD
jgi:ribosome-associated protein